MSHPNGSTENEEAYREFVETMKDAIPHAGHAEWLSEQQSKDLLSTLEVSDDNRDDIQKLLAIDQVREALEAFRANEPDADRIIAIARLEAARRHAVTHDAASGWAWVRPSVDCWQCRETPSPDVWRKMQLDQAIAVLSMIGT